MIIGKDPTQVEDDEFDVVLLVVGMGLACAGLGAVMAGAFAVFLVLGVGILLTIAGVVSASLLVGLYRRSLQASFKTLVLIAASLLGVVFGLIIFWLIDVFFHLKLQGYQVLLGGAGGGLVGGFVLGLITYRMMRSVLKIAVSKLKLG